MKKFVQTDIDHILAAVDEMGQRHSRIVAAFDADGTLWDNDAGENFFEYQIKNKLVPLPENPWEHYENLKKTVSYPTAYLWLAQINRGQKITQVRQWARDCMKQHSPPPIHEGIRQIIQRLHSFRAEIYVVTASITWAVEPYMHFFNIPEDHVVGVQTRLVEGVVTTVQDGPITYRDGKVAGLLARTNGIYPQLAAGNSEGDLHLLESALDVRIAVAASDPDSVLGQTEARLLNIAKKNDWYCLIGT